MVPLLNVGRLQTRQYEDIRRVLRSARVPFVELARPPLATYLCVRAKDYEKARALVHEEYREYALAQRANWEREWKEAHQCSYWSWLLHRWRCNTKLVASSIFRFIT